ncbi:uncharacterized protein LOC111100153 [Crassostrea virginica]
MLAYLSCSYLCFELYILFGLVNLGEMTATCTGNRCCDGFFWNNESTKCEKCKPGFIGSNCAISCPYPTYGEQCQGICDCDKNSCDVSTGCRPITTETSQFCLPGYFGNKCRAKCINPSYGEECQGHCDCSEHLCDVTTGCLGVTKEERCLPGFFGRHCNAKCVYPFFGEGCQGHCNCSEYLCDVTNGCRDIPCTDGTCMFQYVPSMI